MSSRRSSSRSIVMRPSARASGAPGQVCAPWPNARCWRALARSTSKSAGHSKRRGITVRGAVDDHHGGARGDLDAAELGRHAREPEVALHRALDAQALLDEVRDALPVLAQLLLQLGVVADALQRGAEEAHRRLLTGGEEVGGDARDVDGLGDRAVGKRRGRHAGHHVVARCAPAVLDVRRELLVEELERVVRERLGAGARRRCRSLRASPAPSRARNSSWSLSGTPSRSATASMRERLAVAADELARHRERRTRRSGGRRAAT